MSAREVGIRFSTTDIPPSGYRDIKLIPAYAHPDQVSSGTVTVLLVELKGPKVGSATLSLISAVKGCGVNLQLSHPSYNYDEEIVRYELNRTVFNKEELLYLRVLNAGEVPVSCSGTLFVSIELAEPEPKVPDEAKDLHSLLDEMVVESSDPDLPADEEEVGLVEGLLRKCRGWFAEGFAAGVAGREGRAGVAALASEAPTVRDSVRVLAMQLASVAEIPLLAARMYWEQVAGLGGGARRSTVLSFGKCTVLPDQQAKVVVKSPWRYRPTGIVVSGRSEVVSYLTITEILVGKDAQPCSTSGNLPCCLFAEHCRPPLALDMDEAGPDKDVTIWVRNNSTVPQEFSGAILADILGP